MVFIWAFFPLQGFLNFFVYIRLDMQRWIRENPYHSHNVLSILWGSSVLARTMNPNYSNDDLPPIMDSTDDSKNNDASLTATGLSSAFAASGTFHLPNQHVRCVSAVENTDSHHEKAPRDADGKADKPLPFVAGDMYPTPNHQNREEHSEEDSASIADIDVPQHILDTL